MDDENQHDGDDAPAANEANVNEVNVNANVNVNAATASNSGSDRPVMNAPVVDPSGARSRESTRQSFIRFINETQRHVDVVWINYEGARVKYETLQPSAHFDVTSYVSHPWIFLDSKTHSKLVTTNQTDVFEPPPPKLVRLRTGQIRPTRAYVAIRLPVYSLAECALQAVQRSLRAPRDAYSLGVPVAVQRELFQRCSLRWGPEGVETSSS